MGSIAVQPAIGGSDHKSADDAFIWFQEVWQPFGIGPAVNGTVVFPAPFVGLAGTAPYAVDAQQTIDAVTGAFGSTQRTGPSALGVDRPRFFYMVKESTIVRVLAVIPVNAGASGAYRFAEYTSADVFIGHAGDYPPA